MNRDVIHLSDEELAEVLVSENKANLLIRAQYLGGNHLLLVAGDGSIYSIPLTYFEPNINCTPNPNKLALDDYGHTVRLGEYEADSEDILNAPELVRQPSMRPRKQPTPRPVQKQKEIGKNAA
jgi:hypothetical protein